MSAPARPLALLLYLGALSISRTSGVVNSPPPVTALVGQSLNLSCSIITSPGDTIHQVRWLNKHKVMLLAYQPTTPVSVSHEDPSVSLLSSTPNSSHITIKALKPEDEGCFFCAFDVYPGGRQEGKPCVTVTGKVDHKSNTIAIAGKPTTLPCSYTLPSKVRQVLWRKIGQDGEKTTLASYSKHGYQTIDGISLNHNLADSQLSIQEVRMEDEACYICEFHTYPDGTKSATTCLSVYVLPKPEVNHVTLSPGVIEATCSTQSKPSAQILWDFGRDNRTLGPPVYSSFNQTDGTTTITSTVLIKSEALSDVSCIIRHPGLDNPLTVPLTNVSPAPIVLITVCTVVVVLLLCLCGCLCKCLVCNND